MDFLCVRDRIPALLSTTIDTLYTPVPRDSTAIQYSAGDVAFSEYIFCTIAVFPLYGEYVVRSSLPDGVCLPCDHGLDF